MVLEFYTFTSRLHCPAFFPRCDLNEQMFNAEILFPNVIFVVTILAVVTEATLFVSAPFHHLTTPEDLLLW